MTDRAAVARLREERSGAARLRNMAHSRATHVRRGGGEVPPAAPCPDGEEPDDDIPEGEAEARKAVVREAKRAKRIMGLDPDLAECELEAILP